jgi:nucleoid DNA-binding protein
MKDKVASKGKIIHALAKNGDIPPEVARFYYDIILDTIWNLLRDGNGIIFPNIGTFRLVDRGSQRSNLTGKTIPPHKRLRFKINPALARYIRVKTREYEMK